MRLDEMKVEVKSPGEKYILGEDVTPAKAIDIIED